MKRIHVMAAVIARGEKILIAKRPEHLHQGGKWEFPGGKLEADEFPFAGLVRELEEELGITARSARPLIRIAHDYPDKHVLLDVWLVQEFSGEPEGKEGQQIRWVRKQDLPCYEFPAANQPIVTAARLPSTYLITPQIHSLDTFVESLEKALGDGSRLIQLRSERLQEPQWQALVHALCEFKKQHDVILLLNSAMAQRQLDGRVLPDVFDGLHLTAQALQTFSARPAGMRWLGASCHSPAEIARAEQLGVDFVTLSPVKPTSSHPDATPLGIDLFQQWATAAHIPVYGLGGLGSADLDTVWMNGGQGVAGISELWPALKS